MSKLPIVSSRKMIKFFKKLGYYIERQKGSHIIMRNDEFKRNVIIPNHKEIDRGTLLSIIKQSGLTRDQFIYLYSK